MNFEKLKLILALVAAVLIGGLVLAAFLFGNGAIQVRAPEGAPATVVVDGKTLGTIAAGGHARYNLEKGKHNAVVSSAGHSVNYSLDVSNGSFDQILQAPQQCFVIFDPTNLVYEKNKFLDKVAEAVTIEEKHAFEKGPFDAPSGTYYFSTREFPSSIEQGHRTLLIDDVPCPLLVFPDADLIKARFTPSP